jgi:hypothetical protein
VTLTPEQARALGQRSGAARRKLTLDDVEAELPALDTPANLRAAYERVARWSAAGLLPGAVAGAVVRAIDGSLRLLEAQIDLGAIGRLEKRVRELEAELAAARKAASQAR